jgi:hypothetical protein
VPDPRRVATRPDADALVGHFDDEAFSVHLAADADRPAVVAIVAVNHRVGDGLGYGEGDGLGYFV